MKVFIERTKKRNYIGIFIVALCAFALVIPLFINESFYADWFRSIWLIQYYGEYFKNHLSFPDVINVYGEGKYVNQVGMMHPVYYGVWLYRVLGFLCSLPGGSPRKALAVLIFVFALIEGWVWYKNFAKYIGEKWICACISGGLVLSIYTVSNLYIGNAIPQHFAVTAISSSVGIWILSLENKRRVLYWIMSAFLFTFAAGTHPITALLGGIFFGAIIIVTLFANRKKIKKTEIAAGGGIAVFSLSILFPWIYAVLSCNVNAMTSGKIAYFEQIDTLWGRLFPLPLNYPTVLEGPMNVMSPYAANQINFAIGLFALCLTIIVLVKSGNRKNRISSISVYLLYVLLLALSSIQAIGNMLPDFFGVIQFSSRLIPYINILGICVCVYQSFLLVKEKIAFQELYKSMVWIIITLTLTAFLQNIVHIKAIENVLWYDTSFKTQLTDAFYNPHDYTDISSYNKTVDWGTNEVDIYRFKVDESQNFGETEKLIINQKEKGYVGLQVYPHTWNCVYVDGQKIENKDIFVDESQDYIYLELEQGQHELEYHFEPDIYWTVGNMLSKVFMPIMGIICILIIVKISREKYLIKRVPKVKS